MDQTPHKHLPCSCLSFSQSINNRRLILSSPFYRCGGWMAEIMPYSASWQNTLTLDPMLWIFLPFPDPWRTWLWISTDLGVNFKSFTHQLSPPNTELPFTLLNKRTVAFFLLLKRKRGYIFHIKESTYTYRKLKVPKGQKKKSSGFFLGDDDVST